MELKEQQLTKSDKDYKHAFVNFIKSRTLALVYHDSYWGM